MAPFGDEDICGLDVSVDDAFGMRGVQSIGNFDRHAEQIFKLHVPTRYRVLQRHAIQILHCDEGSSALVTNIMDSANIRMIQGRRGTGLTFEPFKRLWVVRNVFWQELQSDESAESGVFSLIDDTHAAATE